MYCPWTAYVWPPGAATSSGAARASLGRYGTVTPFAGHWTPPRTSTQYDHHQQQQHPICCCKYSVYFLCPAHRVEGIKRWCASDVCLSVAYIGPKSERRRKTKIGREVAHITRDSDTSFKVKRSSCRGRGHIVAASHTACLWSRLPNVIE